MAFYLETSHEINIRTNHAVLPFIGTDFDTCLHDGASLYQVHIKKCYCGNVACSMQPYQLQCMCIDLYVSRVIIKIDDRNVRYTKRNPYNY